MNANRYFEDDDLALYAMHLLAEPEASALAREVAENHETRSRLAELQARLGAYAQTTVDMQPLPEGSTQRFLERLARERKAVPIGKPASVTALLPETRRTRATGAVLPWVGWALAACLAVAAGKLYHDRTALHATLTAQTGQVVQMSSETADVYHQRDALTGEIAEQEKRIEQLNAAVEAAKSEGETLRRSATSETARLDQLSADLKQRTASVSNAEQARASAERERDTLRATVAAQASQVAQLTTDAVRAREVLDALTDRSALRVTLTRPKSQAAPTGRATYVASRGTLVFLASNMAPLKPDKVYQLWILPADGSKPVPAGTFSPDVRGDATVVHARFPRAVAASGFAVTIENEGGSQTPTLPILLSGASGA